MAKEDQKKILKEFGLKITSQIDKGRNPEITFPLRNLSNIIYDKKTRTLKLGNKKGIRSFFNVAHSKKFLQTVEVASVIKKELLESGYSAKDTDKVDSPYHGEFMRYDKVLEHNFNVSVDIFFKDILD